MNIFFAVFNVLFKEYSKSSRLTAILLVLQFLRDVSILMPRHSGLHIGSWDFGHFMQTPQLFDSIATKAIRTT